MIQKNQKKKFFSMSNQLINMKKIRKICQLFKMLQISFIGLIYWKTIKQKDNYCTSLPVNIPPNFHISLLIFVFVNFPKVLLKLKLQIKKLDTHRNVPRHIDTHKKTPTESY